MDFLFHLILFLNFMVDESSAGLAQGYVIADRLGLDFGPLTVTPPRQPRSLCGWLWAGRCLPPLSGDSPQTRCSVPASGRMAAGPCSVLCDGTGSWEPVGPRGAATCPEVRPASPLPSAPRWGWRVRRALTRDPVTRSRSRNAPVSNLATAAPSLPRPRTTLVL